MPIFESGNIPDYLANIIYLGSQEDPEDAFERLLRVSASLVMLYYKRNSEINDEIDKIIKFLDNGHYCLNLKISKDIIDQTHSIYKKKRNSKIHLSGKYFEALLCGKVTDRMMVSNDHIRELEKCFNKFLNIFDFIFSELPKEFNAEKFSPWIIEEGGELYIFKKYDKSKSEYIYDNLNLDSKEVRRQRKEIRPLAEAIVPSSVSIEKATSGFKYDVFISYRRRTTKDAKGQALAQKIVNQLGRKNKETYRDKEKMQSGAFPSQIKDAIEKSKWFILVFNGGLFDDYKEDSEKKDWVVEELKIAMNHFELEKIIVVLTVNADDGEEFPSVLKGLELCHRHDASDLEEALDQIV